MPSRAAFGRSRCAITGRQHEVARLGSGERDFDGLAIAKLADHDHVWIFTERCFQRGHEAQRVPSDFSVRHDRAFRWMHDLDRIFDRDDVVGVRGVEQIDESGHRRRLAVTARAGDDDEPLVVADGFLELARKTETL
jgi:hypothetical protein